MSRTNLWARLSQFATPGRPRNSSRFARRPGFGGLEGLEDRKLMTATDVADAAAIEGGVHQNTFLYINFDGGNVPTDFTGRTTVLIDAFETEAGDTGLASRDRDIQDILYQVSEVYAPFNVEVRRIYGAGNFSTLAGDTTVFVGGNALNSNSVVSGSTFNYNKYSASYTPGAFTDSQTPIHNVDTDPYDIAFVDPVIGATTNPTAISQSWSTETEPSDPTSAYIYDIRRSIVHEAGHTFGLVHVRSDGLADPQPVVFGTGKVSDVMAYDARNIYFSNQSLPTTTVNNTPTGNQFNLTLPSYIDPGTLEVQTLTTQNSFQALGNILGVRPVREETTTTVADDSLVDPSVGNAALTKVDLSNATTMAASLSRFGDYNAYTFTPTAIALNYDKVTVSGNGGLNPEILVYDQSGQNIVSVVSPYNGTAVLSNLKAGRTYTLVVGAVDGASFGSYSLTVSHINVFDVPGRTSPFLTGSDIRIGDLNATPDQNIVAAMDASSSQSATDDPNATALDENRILLLNDLATKPQIQLILTGYAPQNSDQPTTGGDGATLPSDPATTSPGDTSTTPSDPAPVQTTPATKTGRKGKHTTHAPVAKKVTVSHNHPVGHVVRRKGH